MRRLPIALILLIAPALALADPPRQRYDVTEFGAVPGKDCIAAIDRALAAIDRDDPTGKQARDLYFPGADQPYRVSRPIVVGRDYVRVIGDGIGRTTITPWFGNQISPLVFGFPKTLNGVAFDPTTHWADLFGVADASLAPRAGVAWGLRTRSNAHVGSFAGALDAARSGWRDAPGLLLNVLADAPAGPICGMGGTLDGPSPWRLVCTGTGAYRFEFSDATQQYGSVPHSWTFAATNPAPGPHRVSVWLDLVGGVFAAWVDKVQVATVAAGPAFAPGLQFRRNNYFPFLIGTQGPGFYFAQWGPFDLTIGGLWVGTSNRYGLDGVGTPQRAIDGKTLSDADTYVSSYAANPPAGFVACLSPTGGPTSPNGGRLVTMNAGAASWSVPSGLVGDGRGTNWGLWMPLNSGNGYTWTYGNSVRDLSVDCGNDAWGQCIAAGGVYQFDVRNVSATGGYHGIGSIPDAASYMTTVKDCTLRGVDAGIFLNGNLARIDDILFGMSQETAARFRACDIRLNRCLVTGQKGGDYTVACHDGTYGGKYRITDITIDNEAPYGAPRLATVYIESHAAVAITDLEIDLLRWGTTGPSHVPWLVNNAPSTRTIYYKPVRVQVRNSYPIAGSTAGTIVTYP